ncbi:hypothetical protein ABVK25_006632 [Lepraria finkii]|uniref:Uncharacterized protein n=1 Tax=Lepraria finkii TaxID=1340010 RepID=A0ABR4B5U9_9LECA
MIYSNQITELTKSPHCLAADFAKSCDKAKTEMAYQRLDISHSARPVRRLDKRRCSTKWTPVEGFVSMTEQPISLTASTQTYAHLTRAYGCNREILQPTKNVSSDNCYKNCMDTKVSYLARV